MEDNDDMVIIKVENLVPENEEEHLIQTCNDGQDIYDERDDGK